MWMKMQKTKMPKLKVIQTPRRDCFQDGVNQWLEKVELIQIDFDTMTDVNGVENFVAFILYKE